VNGKQYHVQSVLVQPKAPQSRTHMQAAVVTDAFPARAQSAMSCSALDAAEASSIVLLSPEGKAKGVGSGVSVGGGVGLSKEVLTDEHLLHAVLKFLSPVELAVARQVSRHWLSVADSNGIWRPLCCLKWPSWKAAPMKVSTKYHSNASTHHQVTRCGNQPLPDTILSGKQQLQRIHLNGKKS
jgi:hypothetical protein